MYDFIYSNFPFFNLKIKLLSGVIIGVEFLEKIPIYKTEQQLIGKSVTTTELEQNRLQVNKDKLVEDLSAAKLAEEVSRQLDLYLVNGRFKFSLPLNLTGTEHQKKVCQQMLTIPAGATLSYKAIAQTINSSPRAVGNSCGNNKIALFIPCHRVITASGKLGGFMQMRDGYNLTIKKWLLEHEGAI